MLLNSKKRYKNKILIRSSRKIHKYLSLAISVQLLLWTISGIYFSFNKIEDVSFEAKGCAISIASASIMSEIVKGKTIDEVASLFSYFHKLCTGEETQQTNHIEEDIEKLKVMSGVNQFPSRIKCATMSWHAVDSAINSENA